VRDKELHAKLNPLEAVLLSTRASAAPQRQQSAGGRSSQAVLRQWLDAYD
jgi:hypothetical protein